MGIGSNNLAGGLIPDINNPATNNEIIEGYEAINEDLELLTGVYTPLDTTDATATATDILSGKTAYANDSKVTGTYTPPSVPKSVTYSSGRCAGEFSTSYTWSAGSYLKSSFFGGIASAITVGLTSEFFVYINSTASGMYTWIIGIRSSLNY